MRGDDRSRKFPNSHHERLPGFLRVAVKNLNVLRHRPDGDDEMMMGLCGLARTGSQCHVEYQGKQCHSAHSSDSCHFLLASSSEPTMTPAKVRTIRQAHIQSGVDRRRAGLASAHPNATV